MRISLVTAIAALMGYALGSRVDMWQLMGATVAMLFALQLGYLLGAYTSH